MRLPALALLSALAACATAPGTTASTGAPVTNPTVMIDANGKVIRTSDMGTATSVTAGPAETLRAFAAAYDSVGIHPDIVDPARQLVSRSTMTVSRTLNGARLSTLFDCGEGMSGSRADLGRVTFSITSRVVGTASPVDVSTWIDASVMANDGAAASSVRCGSRGAIEEQIRRVAFRQLGIVDRRAQ